MANKTETPEPYRCKTGLFYDRNEDHDWADCSATDPEHTHHIYKLSEGELHWNRDENSHRVLYLEQPYVTLYYEGEQIGLQDSWVGAWAAGAMYLRMIGGEVGDGKTVLGLARNGSYQIYGSGAMIERGADWEARNMNQEIIRLQAELDAARLKLSNHENTLNENTEKGI